MTDDEIKQVIQNYDDMVAQLELIRMNKREALPKEMRQALEDIDAEFNPAIEAAEAEIARAKKAAEDAVKEAGHTVETDFVQVVFVKGKTTWNSEKLKDYAFFHPEVEDFKKVGNPSAQVRVKK